MNTRRMPRRLARALLNPALLYSMIRMLMAVLLASLFTLMGSVPAAHAATLVVDTNAGSTGLRSCTPQPGDGSLRGALLKVEAEHLSVERSTIVGNRASHGGGISNVDAHLTIINSTISDHVGNVQGGGIWNHGNATIIFSTITRNRIRAEPLSFGNPDQPGGGGLYNGKNVSMGNTILAGNNDQPNGTSNPGTDNCFSLAPATFTSLGGTLVGLLTPSRTLPLPARSSWH